MLGSRFEDVRLEEELERLIGVIRAFLRFSVGAKVLARPIGSSADV